MSQETPNNFRTEDPDREREYDDAGMNENADVLHKSISALIEEVESVVNRISSDKAQLLTLRNAICKSLTLHSWYEATKTKLSSMRAKDKQDMGRDVVLRAMLNNIDSHRNRDEAKEIAMELVLIVRKWLSGNKK